MEDDVNNKTREFNPDSHHLLYAPHDALESATISTPNNDVRFRRCISEHLQSIMQDFNGLGLAANQINLIYSVHAQRVGSDVVTMFNPQVINVSNEMTLMSEGCLSEPGLLLKVKRPSVVEVQWEDINDVEYRQVLYGIDARVFLHEFDHLQGIMFTERVSKVKLDMARKKQHKRVTKYLTGK